MLYINHFCNIDPCTTQRYIYTGTKEMSVVLSHCLWDKTTLNCFLLYVLGIVNDNFGKILSCGIKLEH